MLYTQKTKYAKCVRILKPQITQTVQLKHFNINKAGLPPITVDDIIQSIYRIRGCQKN